MHLTYVLGQPIPYTGIRAVITDAEEVMRPGIDAGHGDRQVVMSPEFPVGYDEPSDIAITERQRAIIPRLVYEKVTWGQLYEALDLLNWCSSRPMHGGTIGFEFWSYMFYKGKMIGYLMMESDRYHPNSLLNSTGVSNISKF